MKTNKPAKHFFKQPTSLAVSLCWVASAALGMPALAADASSASDSKGFAASTWNFIQGFISESSFKSNQAAAKPMAEQGNALGAAAARELQAQAATQLQQRDFIGADKTLRRAISLAPGLVGPQAMLALAIDGQGRRAEAKGMLDALIGAGTAASNAASASAVKLEDLAPVASAYASVGDPRRALQIYNQMIAANFETAELHSGRGDALQLLGDDVAALASYQLAAEVEPRFPNLELKRAASLEKLGRVSEAENAYRVALQLDSSSGLARSNLARLEAGRSAAVSVVAQVAVPVPAPATTTATMTPPAPVSAAPAAKPEAVEASAKAPVKVNAASAKDTPMNETQTAVIKQLGLWQAAWSSKEINAYLGFYAKSFAPLKMNRAEWEADRRAKLNKPGAIQVNVVEPSVEPQASGMAVAFTQEYTSSNFRDKTHKRMDWVQEDGEWRIQRETTLPSTK